MDWIVDWITGLDCWTGVLDCMTFELKLRVPHDFHPIRCAEFSHMFDASVRLIDCRETKDAACIQLCDLCA